MWLFATERVRPLAHGQEGPDKQGRKVERDVRRKCRHGEERECMFMIERSPGDHDGTTWEGDRVTRCVRDRRYPRDIEIDVWMDGDDSCVPDA